MSFSDLTSTRVDDGDGLARIINKRLFSGSVFLPQGDIKLFGPLAVTIAELAVLISFRVTLFILIPEEL
ncbi:hypothetical protein ES703_87656 [subsurface metagenome]